MSVSSVLNSIQQQQDKGEFDLPEKRGVVRFQKIFLSKDQEASEEYVGSLAITEDNNHKGLLHILIYIGQLFNAIFTGKSREEVNLCHSQVIIGINPSEKRKGDLLLAHAVFGGVKTTSESHKKDKMITGVTIYRPVDEKMSRLFLKYAKQTVVNFTEAQLNPKAADFKSRVKAEVPSFSTAKMISCAFYNQVAKPYEDVQRRIAFAAADLLKKDKFRDEKGNLAAFYCTSFMLTLTQATTLIGALDKDEKKGLKAMSRNEIAQHLFEKIKTENQDDLVSASYWNNEFMKMDASTTMSYAAAGALNKNSFSIRDHALAAPAA